MSPLRNVALMGEPSAGPVHENALHALRRYFGYSRFRSLQLPIVGAMLDGRDVLAVLPTGAGKSICFQLPALMNTDLTLVTSPLISLMQDQVSALRQRGLPAGALTSATPRDEQRRTLDGVASGRLRLLYLSPEMLESPRLRPVWADLQPARLVVDEAHCISEWGHDFRPAYRRIARFTARCGTLPTAAFTATATPATRLDIERCLGLRRPFRVLASVDRPNIAWSVQRTRSLGEAVSIAGDLVRGALHDRPGGAAIVYVLTRPGAAHAAQALRRLGVRAAYYHAGLDGAVRRSIQERFLTGDVRVVCATSAFGMGIDHPRIRIVVHTGMPGALESYVQEAGRAGRDGRAARATLLVTPRDRQIHRALAVASAPGRKEASARSKARLSRMTGYANTRRCRRAYIARYFGERPRACTGCDRCGAAGQP